MSLPLPRRIAQAALLLGAAAAPLIGAGAAHAATAGPQHAGLGGLSHLDTGSVSDADLGRAVNSASHQAKTLAETLPVSALPNAGGLPLKGTLPTDQLPLR